MIADVTLRVEIPTKKTLASWLTIITGMNSNVP